VSVTFEIARTGIQLYDQLVITTDLDAPVWDPVVIVTGQETPLNPAFAQGSTLTINGAVYNYPSAVPVKVRVNVKGTVPYNHTTSQRLLNIRQLDAEGIEYAYPSGYSLPMPGTPSLALSGIETTQTTPTENPVYEDTVPATPTPVPSESAPPIATVPAPRKTMAVPTPWPTSTPSAAAPASLLVVFGAVAMTVYCLRQKPGS
jgi:hypothetical protein